MEGVTSQISAFAAVILALISGFFMVRILALVFVGQIDLAAGRPGALADLAEQAVYMLITLALAVHAQGIGQAFGALAQANTQALLSSDIRQLKVLIEPAARLVLSLAANLAVAFTFMAVVFISVRGQIANLAASSDGLARSIIQGITAIAVLVLGMLALVIGRSFMY
jgi:hypothetical protein